MWAILTAILILTPIAAQAAHQTVMGNIMVMAFIKNITGKKLFNDI
jgi:hypothetical protein